MIKNKKYLVFTDLDATLLDHDTYSWEPARPALEALSERKTPVILNSSKTFREMVFLASEIGTSAPLVCENGALVAIPHSSDLTVSQPCDHTVDGYDIYFQGATRAEAVSVLHTLRHQNPGFKFKGYQDWSVEEVSAHTQLPMEKARASKHRLGTEPIHWHGTQEDFIRFKDALSTHSLTAVEGGRFIHISGEFTKATGLLWLTRLYENSFPEVEWLTVALGDSPNDVPMLSAAKIAIVLPNHTELNPSASKVIRAKAAGPHGWNTELLKLFKIPQ